MRSTASSDDAGASIPGDTVPPPGADAGADELPGAVAVRSARPTVTATHVAVIAVGAYVGAQVIANITSV